MGKLEALVIHLHNVILEALRNLPKPEPPKPPSPPPKPCVCDFAVQVAHSATAALLRHLARALVARARPARVG